LDEIEQRTRGFSRDWKPEIEIDQIRGDLP